MKDQDKTKVLLRAMTDVDDQYIREAIRFAENGKRAQRAKVLRFRRAVGILATVAALLVVGVISSRISGVRLFPGKSSGSTGTSSSAPAVASEEDSGTQGNALSSAADESAVNSNQSAAGSAEEGADNSEGTAVAESAEEAYDTMAAAGNPYQEVASLAEAAQITGFDLQVPAARAQYSRQVINVIDDTMIEVSYTTADGSDTGYSVRKAEGTEDISGDYNDYPDTVTENLETQGTQAAGETVTVTLKGNAAEDQWSVATWTIGDYTYAIDAQDHPQSRASIMEKVSGIE